MRSGRVVVFATGMLLIASGTGHAKGGNQGLLTNEQRTAACQQYINALYPPTTGQMDRQRKSAYAANTGAGTRNAPFFLYPSFGRPARDICAKSTRAWTQHRRCREHGAAFVDEAQPVKLGSDIPHHNNVTAPTH